MKYFVTNQYGQVSIQEWEADMSNNRKFQALTTEQLEYFAAHPNASVYEVKNLIEHTEPTLEDIKARVIEELSELSLQASESKVKGYQLSNAIASLAVPEGEGVYLHAKAQQIVDSYTEISIKCRNKFYQAKEAIEQADNITDVENIRRNAVNFYESI